MSDQKASMIDYSRLADYDKATLQKAARDLGLTVHGNTLKMELVAMIEDKRAPKRSARVDPATVRQREREAREYLHREKAWVRGVVEVLGKLPVAKRPYVRKIREDRQKLVYLWGLMDTLDFSQSLPELQPSLNDARRLVLQILRVVDLSLMPPPEGWLKK